ncbi:MAG: penicillin-binding protein 1A [Burkholderiales bacterium]|nr:penicillin-binding protein 1A [Burkholderiales bacterium]
MITRWFLYLSSVILGLALVAGLLGGFVIALLYPTLPDLDVLTDYQPRIPLRVVSKEGVLLGEFGEERRSVVYINDVPQVLKEAILAAEDERFYSHGGIDYPSVLRAAIVNLTSNKLQGGGTITMQVARNFFLTREKTLTRKLREALLAWKIEANLSKDQILELYINQIFLGQRAYGFAAAAQIYYGKNLADITPAEAAMLAGLPAAPSAYNPLVNPQRAKWRQAYVLRRMHELKYLDDEAFNIAKNEPLNVRRHLLSSRERSGLHAEYIAEMARQKAVEAYGREAYTRGLTVWTTISAEMQETAYRSVRQGVLDYERRHGYRGPESYINLPDPLTEDDPDLIDQAFQNLTDYDDLLAAIVLDASAERVRVLISNGTIATITGAGLRFAQTSLPPKAPASIRLRRGAVVRVVIQDKNQWAISQLPQVEASFVALHPQNGSVLALVGGFDFERNQFNHTTQALRQPGSSFKPFIYSAALEKGFSPATVVNDGPFFVPAEEAGGQDWEPKNYGGDFEGPMSLRTALAKSKNLVSVRVLQAITPQYAQDYITKFGFSARHHPPYLTMGLGAGSATPIQMAAAYAVFANGGFRIDPFFIDRITDARDNTLYTRPELPEGEARQVAIDPRNAFIMTTMLRDVVTRGTAARAMVLKRHDLAGKTGTTNDSIDTWFCGYNAHLVGVAWLGFSQPKSLGNRETGSVAALPIWISFMQAALKDVPETPLNPPPHVVSIRIDPETGQRSDKSALTEWFYSEFQPEEEALPMESNPSLERIF